MAVETRTDAAAAEASATPPVNVTVSAMDSFIPTIPDANPEGIERRFKYSTLTKIEGGVILQTDVHSVQRTFPQCDRDQVNVRRRKAWKYWVRIQSVTLSYIVRAQLDPVFSAGATNDEKKKEVAEFIDRETYIRVAEMAEEHLKNQFLEAINKEYITELRQGVLRYD